MSVLHTGFQTASKAARTRQTSSETLSDDHRPARYRPYRFTISSRAARRLSSRFQTGRLKGNLMQLTRHAFLQAMSIAAFFTAAPAVWAQPERKPRMKLICIEEHVLDGATAAASMPAALKAAPYLPDRGKTVKDGNRPRNRP